MPISSTMATRRVLSITDGQIRPLLQAEHMQAQHRGMTMSLLIIVDSATHSTITMPVAAENPPM